METNPLGCVRKIVVVNKDASRTTYENGRGHFGVKLSGEISFPYIMLLKNEIKIL